MSRGLLLNLDTIHGYDLQGQNFANLRSNNSLPENHMSLRENFGLADRQLSDSDDRILDRHSTALDERFPEQWLGFEEPLRDESRV